MANNPPPDPVTSFLSTPPEDNATEQSLWTGGYSSAAMIGTWVLLSILSVVVLGISLIVAFVTIPIALLVVAVLWVLGGLTYGYRRLSFAYELTNQRFIHKTGLLTRRTDRIEVIDIDDVVCKQGPVERLLGVGTIEIESSDRTHPTLILAGIAEVTRVAGLIDDVRRQERRRRSVHIESI